MAFKTGMFYTFDNLSGAPHGAVMTVNGSGLYQVEQEGNVRGRVVAAQAAGQKYHFEVFVRP
jgi:hypothetical protein